MSDTVENLVLDLLEWLARKERTYHETLDAWRTSCPRLPVWEEANERGLLAMDSAGHQAVIRVTPAGLAFLKNKRPSAFEELQRQA